MISIYLTGVENALKLITVAIIFVIVLALTHFTTKWIGNYQKNKVTNGNIEVLEAASITNGKTICIVRIADEYYALGLSKETISVISKVDKEKMKNIPDGFSINKESFSKILNKITKHNQNNKEE